MIHIDFTGRTCEVDGPATMLLVSMVLSVRVGTQRLEECFLQETVMPSGAIVPDGYRAYEMTPGMTYNILREADKPTRTFMGRVAVSVMVDRKGQSWIGRPSEWKPIGEQIPTVWSRLLAD